MYKKKLGSQKRSNVKFGEKKTRKSYTCLFIAFLRGFFRFFLYQNKSETYGFGDKQKRGVFYIK